MSTVRTAVLRLRYRALVAVYRLKQLMPNRARRMAVRALDVADAGRRAAWRIRHGGPPAAPASLRRRVGSKSLRTHLEVGAASAADLQRVLAGAGRPLRAGDRVLDWGCGSGRIALYLLEQTAADLRGCDVDAEAIGWLRRAVPGGEERFQVSGFAPPLPYEDGSFDVLYGVSVFTHLNEQDQLAWLPELARVLVPGGTALLTTAGPHAIANPLWRGIPQAAAKTLGAQQGKLEERGFVFVSYAEDLVEKPDKWTGVSGDYGLAYQTEDWTREHWSDVFEVSAVLPGALNAYQDAVIATPRG